MFIYKVKENCTLTVQSRKRFFKKNEEVQESAYTKAFPKYFKKIGEINIKKPHQAIIMKPILTRKDEAIENFLEKEKILKNKNFKEVNNFEEILKNSKQNTKQNKQSNKQIKQQKILHTKQETNKNQIKIQEIEKIIETFNPPEIKDKFPSQE